MNLVGLTRKVHCSAPGKRIEHNFGALRTGDHKVKPDGAPSSKLKRYRVGKYSAIGALILSLIRYVYILMQG